ncbi:hypothetical protein [Actinacidiphila oryziradicis]|uniref:hypothetical protein n=1 Tax=Actinacidiphila oryziradicis TaxID=2571141 RepID=UPI001B80CE19|nr:hypothetical protein [Actinacidiphila oryziradicis]
MAGEAGEGFARSRALSVLRIRSAALAVALLPAAVAVVLLVGGATGRISGSTSHTVRWSVVAGAMVVLLLAGGIAAVIVRGRPAVSPTVPVAESAAPDLYRLVRDLAVRLQVPPPSAIELTPDCDSWLEDRRPVPGGIAGGVRARLRHAAGTSAREARRGARRPPLPPVLVIGSPFMWWMRVAELRALLAPVVAGTGPSADPEIAAARRFVRGLDAAAGIAARRGSGSTGSGLARPAYAFLGWIARLLLRGCQAQAAEMERAVAASASERAQAVDYGLRIVAQEQVGLAYAGWDRLLTRVALPAWRMGRWPSRLDAGVVAALTELSRRDRLAEGFESRLGERPACDLLEEPGTIDEAASLLAAKLFHGGPEHPGSDWSPVGWDTYPEEVVDRIWRSDAARLIGVLDEISDSRVRPAAAPASGRIPVTTDGPAARPSPTGPAAGEPPVAAPASDPGGAPAVGSDSRAPGGLLMGGHAVRAALPPRPFTGIPDEPGRATLARVLERLVAGGGEELAARITGQVAREAAAGAARARTLPAGGGGPGQAPVYELLPPRTGRELLTDHVTAMVCCAAVDSAGAAPGLDWLDGPALLVNGARRADLAWPVLRLVENGDAAPLRSWLTAVGVRLEKPVRLV